MGYTEFATEKYGNMVSVFYPIEKRFYTQLLPKWNTKWFRDGKNTLEGFERNTRNDRYGKNEKPAFFLRKIFSYLIHVDMDTVYDGPVCEEFVSING